MTDIPVTLIWKGSVIELLVNERLPEDGEASGLMTVRRELLASKTLQWL